MAIVTFYSEGKKETGQSLSVAAIATSMAIEHNYKILIVDTSFGDKTLERCFFEQGKEIVIDKKNKNINDAVASGIEGLIKVIASNKTTPEIVRNYSKTILRERLDFLQAPSTTAYRDYLEIVPKYINVLNSANRFYDFIFVDLGHKIPKDLEKGILENSDIVMYNLRQNIDSINQFIELKNSNDFLKQKNIMLLVSKCDLESKYNIKNITRYLKEKHMVSSVPYNTLFFEACSENKVIDYVLKFRKITDDLDKNAIFIKTISKTVDDIVEKLQELQMRA